MQSPNLSVRSLIADFLRYSQYERVMPVSGQTLETYIKRLDKIGQIWGDRPVLSIGDDDIRRYRGSIIERGCQPTYANSIMMILRSFFRYCREERCLDTVKPCSIKLLTRSAPRVRYLRLDEILRFVKAINTSDIYGLRFMAFVTTLLDTGMRISEALSLDRTTIDWETKTAFIRGKGDKEGVVMFRDWSEHWIKEYLRARTDRCQALFVTHNPQQEIKRIVPEDIRRYFRVIGEKAGLGRVHPHMLRKTASTTLYESCDDIRQVQQFLRHSKVTTTEWYVGKNMQRLQRTHSEFLHYGKAEEMHLGTRVQVSEWTKNGKYLKCLSCQETKRPHVAKGYCDKCYIRRWRKGIVKPKKPQIALTCADNV